MTVPPADDATKTLAAKKVQTLKHFADSAPALGNHAASVTRMLREIRAGVDPW